MTSLPEGTITFLFTDIESSTKRWELRPVEMRASMASHDSILTEVVEAHGGRTFKHTGDGMLTVFVSPQTAADAAVELQRRLQSSGWSGDDRLRVRIGLHTGEAYLNDSGTDYYGQTIIRATRVMDVANGDQIAVSSTTAPLVVGYSIEDRGPHLLKGIGSENVGVLMADGLVVDERPLRARSAGEIRGIPPLLDETVGRRSEVDAIVALGDSAPLVTLVGVGGVGKTRLALEAAKVLATEFPDGVAFCELASVTQAHSVAEALAQSIGARLQPGLDMAASIANFVADRRMLIVVDNCEHVLDTTRYLVEMLTGGRSLVVATSREPLHCAGERVFPVAPLEATSDAVELFCARASERDAHFSASEQDRAAIAELCAALDGIPLAIELAAARARVLSPQQLLERIADRFRVLRDAHTDGRHRTLRDTVLWSYEQLADDEARMFERLSVFRGGFSLEAVAAVCADDTIDAIDSLDLVEALVDKSMVEREAGRGRVRFRMLQTLQQFAADALDQRGESQHYLDLHQQYFADMVSAQCGDLLGASEADIWVALGQEWANIRRSIETARARGDLATAVATVLDLGWWGVFSMRFEVFALATDLIDRHGGDELPNRGSLLGAKALGAYFSVDPMAEELARQGLDADPSDPFGYCHGALAAVYLNNVLDVDQSDLLTREWLDISRSQVETAAMWAHGMRAFHLGTYTDDPAAGRHADKVREIAARTHSASAAALAGWAEGLALVRVDPREADRRWRDGLDKARSLSPDHLLIHLITGLRLHMMAGRGDLRAACELTRDSLQLGLDQHYLAGTSHLFGVAGICLVRAGRTDVAARLLVTMIAHGHQPRSNARGALARALGSGESELSTIEPISRIADAGLLAIEELDSVIAELDAVAADGQASGASE
ncbi:MAG: adenylate/guanylate cyclase domain-containing protein [Acidimicrobiales bacterium]